MANKPIEMKLLKTVLRMHTQGYGQRAIARHCGLSRNTITKYLSIYARLPHCWDELEQLSEEALSHLFLREQDKPPNERLETARRFFPYMSKELRKVGVTRQLLWEEYKARHPDGYMRSQFCEHFARWGKRTGLSMHIPYKAGDKLLVDYSGKKLKVVDPETGEVCDKEVFVAVLGASQLLYVEASDSQRKADFIGSCERALHFCGGVPRAIVTDNLKSAVVKSNRYEPRLNPDFADFADHYETAILPTRAYKPKDKALVEGAVRISYQQIFARLRHETFTSLEALNAAITELLAIVNARKLSGRPYSRRELFSETEAEALAPLPATRFELREYAKATVLQNSHVCLSQDKHYYSVPYTYIRKPVKLAYTTHLVKVYCEGHCIATHERIRSPYGYTTEAGHLASSQKEYTKWNPDYFLKWAASIHEDVALLISHILEKRRHPEQAYKSCVGILRLAGKVDHGRFIRACTLALEYERYSYMGVVDILERKADLLDEEPARKGLPTHPNIRGGAYYADNEPTQNS